MILKAESRFFDFTKHLTLFLEITFSLIAFFKSLFFKRRVLKLLNKRTLSVVWLKFWCASSMGSKSKRSSFVITVLCTWESWTIGLTDELAIYLLGLFNFITLHEWKLLYRWSLSDSKLVSSRYLKAGVGYFTAIIIYFLRKLGKEI